MAYALYQTIVILLDVLWWIIIIQAVMSWLIAFNVVNMGSDFVRTVMVALDRMTAPMGWPTTRAACLRLRSRLWGTNRLPATAIWYWL